MEISDFGRQDFNVQKIMSCNQDSTEWKKSSPLKTYSKKSTPPSADKGDGKSRYGRSHKPRMSGDFLSTDKKVSQYLKIDVDNQMHYFKASPYPIQKSPVKPIIPGAPRGRGRPPKALAAARQVVADGKYQALNEAFDRVMALSTSAHPIDLQAPPPTSTETVDMPDMLICDTPREEPQSDSEEVINENDWNVGDLAWACVGGYPYWPCAVTKEPEQNVYRKMKMHGKSKQQREFIHVRFFGDKGRRSWIVGSNIIPFHGLDSFQSLAEETCTTPSIRKKDPKTYKSFTILPSVRKTWQAAVSEAESLREAPRHERVQYFTNMFPPSPYPEVTVLEKPPPKKRGRKSKAELAALAAAMGTPYPEVKKIKLESPDLSYPAYNTPRKAPRLTEICIKKEPVTPPRICRTPSPTATTSPSIKVKIEPASTPLKMEMQTVPHTPISTPLSEPLPSTSASEPVKKKRGRPKKIKPIDEDVDFVPNKRKYEKKSIDRRLKENRPKKNSDLVEKSFQKKSSDYKKFRDPAFEMFYEKNFDRVSSENPSLSEEDIDRFIDKMWREVKEQKPMGFRSKNYAENMSIDSGNDSKSETSSRSSSPPPITLPSSKTPYRRGVSLFSGVKSDKVCQVCLKNGESGEIIKCRGPCGLPFHLECSAKNRYQLHKPSDTEEEKVIKKKRGRPRSVNNTNSPMLNVVQNAAVNQFSHEVDSIILPPSSTHTPALNVDGSPEKKKRGRPRKYPLPVTPSTISNPEPVNGQPENSANRIINSPTSNDISLPEDSSVLSNEKFSTPWFSEDSDEEFLGFYDMPEVEKLKRSEILNAYRNFENQILQKSPSPCISHGFNSSSSDSGVKCNDSFMTQKENIDEINLELSSDAGPTKSNECVISNGMKNFVPEINKTILKKMNDSESSNSVSGTASVISGEFNSYSLSDTTSNENNKLLATLRGDSFESETSNNNLIVDDSSTDDRLIIKESPPQNDSCETTAVMSILNSQGDSLYNDITSSQSIEANPNKDNKETDSNVRKISLDMPDLDFSESEDTMPPIMHQNKSNEVGTISLPTQLSSNKEIQDKITSAFNLTETKQVENLMASQHLVPKEIIQHKVSLDPLSCELDSLLASSLQGNGNILSKVDIPLSGPLHVKEENEPMDAIESNIDSCSRMLSDKSSVAPIKDTADEEKEPAVKKEVKEAKLCLNASRRKSVDVPYNNNLVSTHIKEEGSQKTLDSEAKNKWMCSVCSSGKPGPCFVCSKEVNDSDNKLKCGYCSKTYHEDCAQLWPQGQKSITAKGRVLYHCPQHVCHTCVSDNPSCITARFANDKLVRCVRCPVTYHHGNFCIPAGSEILSISQILCPKHYRPSKKSLQHVSASWCMLCANENKENRGPLLCCDLCPNSFHLQCLKLKEAPQGPFYCEDCETGRFPLFGEIVWVKLGAYRWWPARILFPQEIPDNILQLPHTSGEFAVEFFGSHDYYWVNRGRCFIYHEGDGCCQPVSKSRTDELFMKGVEESKLAFQKWTEERANREASNRPSMKPPKYQKLQSNKIVGNAAKYIDTNKECFAQTCDCDPTKPNPCGPDSDCINRLLSVECDPQVCPAGENCCNRNFEQRCYPRLEPFKTETRGWGLKTLDSIPKGSFIIEYVGEMIDEEEYQKRLANMQKNKDENFYFLTIDKDRMLDAGPKGNVSRFMNHSCDPNCETQKWTVNGDTRVGLFALENILPDTELVFNYNLATIGDTKVECKCGSASCSGFIGVKNINKNNKQAKGHGSLDEKKGSIKKKRRKSKPSTKHTEDTCFTCGNGGELLLCDDASCPKAYHLSCLGLTKHPAGGWVCPWHQCSVCSATKVQRCTLCINSYCADHADGNISLNRTHGLLCFSHNPSDSGSDWSDERGTLSDEEDSLIKKLPAKKYSKSKMVNGHVD